MPLTIKFKGLCAFCGPDKSEHYSVVMVPGHSDHRPVLAASIIEKSKPIDPATTTWKPDEAIASEGFDSGGNPYTVVTLLWYLDSTTVEMVGSTGKVGWLSPNAVIRFEPFHTSVSRRSIGDVIKDHPATAVFDITEGTLTTPSAQRFDLKQNGKFAKACKDTAGNLIDCEDVARASAVTLTTANLVLQRDRHRKITFVDGACVTVSNLSARPTGNATHFHHYSDIVDVPSTDDRIAAIGKFPPFYDCVPPTGMP